MRSALERIQLAASSTTPSLVPVGLWMTAHPIQTLSQSAEEIAALTVTSVAAVNRFSKAAGFKGFGELKAHLGVEMQSAMEPVLKLGRARQEPELTEMAEAVRGAGEAPQIATVAAWIIKARRVWFLGLGASSHLAGYAVHTLMPFVEAIETVAGEGGTEEVARRLMRCGKGDVLIALSLPRYSKDTVHLVRFARDRGASIVVITDDQASPLSAIAHILLLAPAAHGVLPSSAIATMAVIEALASGVMAQNPNAVRLARDLAETVLAYLAPRTASPDNQLHEEEEP